MVDCVSGGLEFWHRNIKEGKIEPAGGLMAHVGIGGSAEASGDRRETQTRPVLTSIRPKVRVPVSHLCCVGAASSSPQCAFALQRPG